MALVSFEYNTTLSPLFKLKSILSNNVLVESEKLKFSTESIWSPASRSDVKITAGYLLDDGFISSIFKLSSIFFLEVACLDLDAFALNLAIKSSSSFFFSSDFLFCWVFCLNANWLDSYQNV